ncbi:MAG: multi-sensor hybrid histidine kinase [Rhodopila sp.]|nr:multi-sensor hybrid histidine kinase [Rhodopila sp.]
MVDLAAGLTLDEADSLISVLLAELTAGVCVFTAARRLRTTSSVLGAMLDLPGRLTRPGTGLTDILEHAADRGLLTDPNATLDLFAQPLGGTLIWAGTAGRRLELTVRRLSGDGRLALWRDVTDRERDRETLREERARTQHMLNYVTDAIVLMDPDGVILENSDRTGRLLAVPPELVTPGGSHQNILRHLYRRGDYGFDTPEDDFVQQRRAAILAAGHLTFTVLMPNSVWAEYNFHPMPNRQLLAIVRDVTALKTQEIELRETLEQQAAVNEVLRAIGRSAFDLNEVLRIILASAATLCQAGQAFLYRRRDNAYHFEVGHGGEPPAAERVVSQDRGSAVGRAAIDRKPVQTAGGDIDGSMAILTMPVPRDGVPVAIISLTRFPPEPFTERQIEVLSTFADQTMLAIESARLRDEREAGYQALSHERALLRSVLENMNDGVALFEANGDALVVNPAFHTINRFPPEVFKDILSIQGALRWQFENGALPRKHPSVEQDVAEQMRIFASAEEHQWVRETSDENWIEVHWKPLAGGRQLVIHRDITEMKQQQQALQQARDALEQEGEQLRAILDHLPDGVALAAKDGELVHMNAACRELNFPPIVGAGDVRTMRDAMGLLLRFAEVPIDPETIEAHLDHRMAVFLESGISRRETRRFGRYLDIRWVPLPDGRRLILHRDITELREREIELRQAHEATDRAHGLMRDVLDSMIDGVSLYGEAGETLFSNRSFRTNNRIPDDVAGGLKTMEDTLRWQLEAGEIAGPLETIDDSVAAMLVPFNAREPRHRVRQTPDGRWVDVHWLPLPRGRMLAIHRDVTELKQQEQAVVEARKLMETVLNNMTDGVMLYDRDGVCVYANKSFFRIQESTPERIARLKTFPKMMDSLFERGAIDAAFREAALARFARADGTPKLRQSFDGRWSEGGFHRLDDGGTLGIFRDVTDFIRNENELREARASAERQHEIMRVMFDHMTDGLVLAEADGGWTMVNNALYRINGWPIDIPSNSCSADDVRAMLESGHLERRCANIEDDIDRVRRRFTDADGSPVDFHCGNGNRVEERWLTLPENRRLGMYRDITALKVQEERLALERDAAEAARREAEAANQAKSTFLAAMSHEIRTPMNGVLGMMEVLERTYLSATQQRHVAVMRDSANSLLRIIDDILDFSKIDAGKMELEALPFSLHGLIAGAVDTFAPQARRKGIALFADPATAGPDWMDGDPTRVRQILFNLIGNALKFTERGFVRISATSTIKMGAAYVTLIVEDSGIGMNAAQLARLFVPFCQADTSTTRRFGGTGLGLSIVRRLAELMGGSATAESVAGRGSRFIVTLRFGLASPPVVQPAVPIAPRTALPNEDWPRLLVADDNPVNREVIERQLELLGLAGDFAADGREALELWRIHRHAVVLLDIHMPELDGFQVARAIRREEPAAGPKRSGLIAVTANALKGEDERCFAAGMDGFVTKPISLDALARALARFLPGFDADGVPPGPQTGAAFDPEALRGLFGADPTRLSRLFEMFADAATADLASLRAAETAAAQAEAAHRLKGAARMVGARMLADQASQVEAAARAGDFAATGPASERLAIMLAETVRTARASFAAEYGVATPTDGAAR